MTSKFKALTDPIPPLSSAVNIAVRGQPSKPSAGQHSLEGRIPSTTTLKSRSVLILPPARSGLQVKEIHRQHAMILRAVLSRLEKDGLIKRWRVSYPDRTTLKEIQITFDASIWSELLDLRELSGSVVGEVEKK